MWIALYYYYERFLKDLLKISGSRWPHTIVCFWVISIFSKWTKFTEPILTQAWVKLLVMINFSPVEILKRSEVEVHCLVIVVL